MSEQPISDEVALRIALAARALPEVSVGELIAVLQKHLGDDISEKNLNQIKVTHLKTAFVHKYNLKDVDDANTEQMATFKKAAQILWGETEETYESLPTIEPLAEGGMPESIRVAVASNNGEELDGHFGSCIRYLIYQLSATEMKLIDIRSALEANSSDDKNAFRVKLIEDCHVLLLVSIGGPAAAKVIKADIYPMKKAEGGSAREFLAELQKVMATSPPPWLAKLLGVGKGDRVKNYKAVSAE